VDIWAIGVLIYYLIDGNSPFEEKSEEKIRNKILRNQVTFETEKWDDVSFCCKKFIKKCLNYNPEDRPTAEDLLSDPFIMRDA
jgi:serine/threonine protein kinase